MKTKHLLISLTLGLGLMLALLLALNSAEGLALSGPPAVGPRVALAQAGTGVIRVATSGTDVPTCGGESTPCRTVQYAVNQASSGDSVLVATGTYSDIHLAVFGTITQVVYVDRSLTIRGGYNSNFTAWDPDLYPTTLDARGLGRVVYITGGLTVTLDSLRIVNGSGERGGEVNPDPYIYPVGSGGGVHSDARFLTVRNCVIMSNTAHNEAHSGTAGGGGIYQGCAQVGSYCSYAPTLVMEDSSIISNTADYNGGGIFVEGGGVPGTGDVTIRDVQFTGNRSNEDGGGVYACYSSLTLLDSDFVHNVAWDDDPVDPNDSGGGLYLIEGGPVLLDGNTFVSNTADIGGGLFVRDVTLTMTDNLIQDNISYHYAGGTGVYQCAAYLSDNTFEDNRSEGWGGGLEVTWGDLTLTHNAFQGNTASDDGGGFYGGGLHDGHTYTITYNLFQGNVAALSGSATGGGARLLNGALGEKGWIIFSHNRVIDNVASAGPTGANGGRGGGVHVTGPALVSDNLFQNNWASSAPPQGGYYYGGYGGALYLMGKGTPETGIQVTGNRFLDNHATRNAGVNNTSEAFGGAVFVHYNSVVTMTNNIFAGNEHCAECTGWFAEWYRGGGAVAVEGSHYASPPDTYLYLYHNTFVSNQSSAVRCGHAASTVMSHNIFADHDTDVLNVRMYDYVCPVTTLDYTLWWPSKEVRVDDIDNQCSLPLTTHDFTGDPDFVDASQDDYHLGAASQAVDRGPGVGVLADIDGHPRPIGAGYDLGADEYTCMDFSSSCKTAVPEQAAVGETVTFTLVLRNAGSADSPATLLHDPIPTATTYVSGSAQATSGTLDDTDGIAWQGNVGAGQSVTITFQVTIAQEGVIQNIATLTDTYNTVRQFSAWINRPHVYLPLVMRNR